MELKTILSLSGGKDSAACLAWALENCDHDKLEIIFCDTGWEHPETYQYIRRIVDQAQIKFTVLTGIDMLSLVKKEGRWPSAKARFCTEHLKIRRMIDYLLDGGHEHVVVVDGIRRNESAKRSKMSDECTCFKYYFTPYGHTKKGKPKYFTYRKADVVARKKQFVTDVRRPMFYKSAQEVIEITIAAGLEVNPLYRQGAKRVGCFPCVLLNLPQFDRFRKRYPVRLAELRLQEFESGRSFFPPGYIPDHACTSVSVSKKGKRVPIPSIDDVCRYLDRKQETLHLFGDPDEHLSCQSFFGLCE